ncbi:EAL domain-containing protein [Skermania piniformis]|uniref:EAL domain-containing protein n=1 Tax=Skermania pinensis TaxID=39122 RepID=A0ABX8S438_9ACTN|nr:EAL domain-containing protein [Skermania piniformis]QXQ12493.1 EAL domain-containing protein [Skermania piniformis]
MSGDSNRDADLAGLVQGALLAESEQELFQLIADWLAEQADAGRASIALIAEDDPNSAEVLASAGPSGRWPIGFRVKLDNSGVGRAIDTGQVQTWTASRDRLEVEGVSLADAGMRELINAPLWDGARVIGSLNYAKRDGDTITAQDVGRLTEVAAILSLNLGRFRLLSRGREAVARERRLQTQTREVGRTGLALSTAGSPQEVYETVGRALASIMPVDRVSVALPRSDYFDVIVLVDKVPVTSPPERLAAPGTAMSFVVAHREMKVWQDVRGKPAYPEHRALAEAGMHAVVSMPVMVSGAVAALFDTACANRVELGPDTRQALRALTDLTGAALERMAMRPNSTVTAGQFGNNPLGDHLLREVVEESSLLMLAVRADGTIAESSRFAEQQIGRDAGSLREAPITSLYPTADRPERWRRMAALVAAEPGQVDVWEAPMVDAAGRQRLVRHTVRRLDSAPGEAVMLIVAQDVGPVRLPSRRAGESVVEARLPEVIDRRELDRWLAVAIPVGAPTSLCFVDVDHMRLINEISGRQVGDAILGRLLGFLAAAIGTEDVLARLDGDDFAILMPGRGVAAAFDLAERVRAAARDLVVGSGENVHRISVSVGVAALDDSPDPETGLRDAEAACYAAKAAGRDRVAVSGGPGSGPSISDARWVEWVRWALDHDGLQLFGQPIRRTDPAAPQLVGLELLLRLVNVFGSDRSQVEGDVVPAGRFIPACERFGLIEVVDRWVVRELVSSLAAHPDRYAELSMVSVNLSACSVQSPDFLDFLLDALSVPGIERSKIVFEVTETTAMMNFSTAGRFLRAVNELGCSCALDDFGSGFASFSYLRKLPLDLLKIDGSLIVDLRDCPANQHILAAIIQVARALGMQTVAECVDSPDELDTLARIGVDFAQGFGLGVPEPLPRLLAHGWPVLDSTVLRS